jgi:hypothetical protein
VGHQCQVVLDFTEDGVFWRSVEGDFFTAHGMFQGYAPAISTFSSFSPAVVPTGTEDFIVHWRFIATDGAQTNGRVIVRQNGPCHDGRGTHDPRPL